MLTKASTTQKRVVKSAIVLYNTESDVQTGSYNKPYTEDSAAVVGHRVIELMVRWGSSAACIIPRV